MSEFRFRLRSEPVLEPNYKAFPYQEEATEFVAAREFAAIFHEQGLGKTKIAIDLILRWLHRAEVDTVLVFTKKGLVANWEREFSRHSQLKPLVLSEKSNKNYYVFTTPTRLVLSHFEVARKEIRRLKAWLSSRRVGVIMDESAKIKNPNSNITQAFFELRPLFAKRVIMTGTPVANRPYDIWAQVFFLDGGVSLGMDFNLFRRETDLKVEYKEDSKAFEAYQQRLAGIHERIASFSIRETKNSNLVVLPAKEFERIECDWEPSQFELYRQVRDELRAIIIKDGNLVEEDQESILKRLLRLVQIASNPAMIDESYTRDPGKFETLFGLLSDITRQGEKAIVWTNFNDCCEWLAKKLVPFGAHPLNGRMTLERRNTVVKWFLDNPEDRVLVATPGVAKEGLTLTVANHVIFYDRTYSLDDYLQAQDRIHRVSQKRKCHVYNMIMVDSVDEWIDSLLEEKKLAAQLAQGDIDAETYARRATLGFYEILKRILGEDR
ncbi:MAG: DEAD/DEAH box helicase [Magnetococcus sp. THC-1_WYH]